MPSRTDFSRPIGSGGQVHFDRNVAYNNSSESLNVNKDFYTMPDGTVLNNPYTLTAEEWDLYRAFAEGEFFFNPAKKRSAEAAYNKYQQYVQWYNDQQSTSWETDYNDASSSADRLIDAGLNPNFVGLDGAGTAEAANNVTQAPAPSAGSDFLDVASAGFQFIGTAVQIASGISGLMTAGLQRKMLQLQQSGQTVENASGLIGLVQSLYDFMPDELFESEEPLTGDRIAASVSTVMPSLGLTPEQQSSVDSFLRSPSSSALAERWKSRYQYEKNRQDYFEKNKNPLRYSDDNVAFSRFIAGETDVLFSKQRLELALNRYSARKAELLDPETAANAENLQNELQAYSSEVELACKDLVNSYVRYITSSVDSNNPFSLVCAMSAFNSAIKGQDPTVAGFMSQFLPYFREQILSWFNAKTDVEKADISDMYSVLDALQDDSGQTRGDKLANHIRARARMNVRHFYSTPKMKK